MTIYLILVGVQKQYWIIKSMFLDFPLKILSKKWYLRNNKRIPINPGIIYKHVYKVYCLQFICISYISTLLGGVAKYLNKHVLFVIY